MNGENFLDHSMPSQVCLALDQRLMKLSIIQLVIRNTGIKNFLPNLMQHISVPKNPVGGKMHLANKIIKRIVYLLVVLNFYGITCRHYKDPIIMQKKKIYEANCKNKEYGLEYYYSTSVNFSKEHSIIYLDSKGLYWLNRDQKIYKDLNSDYIIVASPSRGETSVQVKIFCKADNQLIIDTGVVQLDDAQCFEKTTWFYFLDGHAKKKEGDSCFPKGLNVEGLNEIIKYNN